MTVYKAALAGRRIVRLSTELAARCHQAEQDIVDIFTTAFTESISLRMVYLRHVTSSFRGGCGG